LTTTEKQVWGLTTGYADTGAARFFTATAKFTPIELR